MKFLKWCLIVAIVAISYLGYKASAAQSARAAAFVVTQQPTAKVHGIPHASLGGFSDVYFSYVDHGSTKECITAVDDEGTFYWKHPLCANDPMALMAMLQPKPELEEEYPSHAEPSKNCKP